jgi:hypothetical protein
MMMERKSHVGDWYMDEVDDDEEERKKGGMC